MNIIWLNNLIQRTLRDDEEIDALRFAGMKAFMAALAQLIAAGFTAAQLQWFVGKPFQRFDDDDRFNVLVLALALERGTDCVENWQRKLLTQEFWLRMHGKSQFFETDTLPDLETICRDGGMPISLAPVSFAPRNVSQTSVVPAPRPVLV